MAGHIVLVHGACHGGWCWYKVAKRLRSAGHRVSTPDMAASGVDPGRCARCRRSATTPSRCWTCWSRSRPAGRRWCSLATASAAPTSPWPPSCSRRRSPPRCSSPPSCRTTARRRPTCLTSSWRGRPWTGWTQSSSLKTLRASYLLPCCSGHWSREQTCTSSARRRLSPRFINKATSSVGTSKQTAAAKGTKKKKG